MHIRTIFVLSLLLIAPHAFGWISTQKTTVDFRDETLTLVGANGEFTVESRKAPNRIYARGRIEGLSKIIRADRVCAQLDREQVNVMGLVNGATNMFVLIAGYDGVTIIGRKGLVISGEIVTPDLPSQDAFAVIADAKPTKLEATIGPAIPANANSIYCRKWDGLITIDGAKLEYGNGSYHFSGKDKLRFECKRNLLADRWHINYKSINPNCDLKTPPVGWMTWYSVKFDACDEVVMRNARSFMQNFDGYTDEKPVLWVDWEWYHEKMSSSGEEGHDLMTPRKSAYPRGMRAVADDLKSMGFRPALWVAFVNDVRTNALWRAHPEWMLGVQKNWSGAIWGDPTAPGFCEEYIPQLVKLYRDEWGYEAFKWDTLPNANWIFAYYRDRLHDPTMNSAEVFRKMIEAGRKAFGPNVYLESCAVVSDREILGTIDQFNAARIGDDIFDWNGFKKFAVNRILHFYPLHNTAFWADADNLVLREEFSTLAQARTRVTVYGLAGVPITIGDDFEKLDPQRIEMLKKVMPVVITHPAALNSGECLTNNFDMTVDVARDFGSWQLKAWSNLSTNEVRRVSFSAPDKAVWDFWNDRLMTEREFDIAPGDTRLVRVTPLNENAPTLISSSRHLTQGAYEIKELTVDAKGARGVVRSPGKEGVTLTFMLPNGTIKRVKVNSTKREDVKFALNLDSPDVHEVFANPPKSARLQCWYHCLDNFVTEEGLDFDFKSMAEAGISTAHVFFPAYLGDGVYKESARVMSDKWVGYFASIIQAAKRYGISLGFNNCAGWSSSGGPWITPENSMKRVVSSETRAIADADGALSVKLREPPKCLDFYRDLKVFAFPVKQYREGLVPKFFRFRTERKIALDDIFIEAENNDGSWRQVGFYHCDYPNRTIDWRTIQLHDVKPNDKLRVRQARGEFESWLTYRPTKIVEQEFSLVDYIPDVQRYNSDSEQYGEWKPKNPQASGIAEVVELTKFMKPNGQLEVPSSKLRGEVLVVRIGFTTTGEAPHPTTLRGLECDKLNAKGIDAHWSAMPAKLLALPDAKTVIKSALIDSYEVGGQNWSDNLPSEFKRRRGYEVGDNLLRVCGYQFGSAGDSAKFLKDWQRTISELIIENYYGRFTELCHAAGIESAIEPYGGPYDCVEAGHQADIPTVEFWSDNSNGHDSLRIGRELAISGRHKIIAAESFTSRNDNWQLTPYHLKEWANRFAWINGVNQLVIHSYCHQPNANRQLPGFSLGIVGTQLNGNTLWWSELKHWNAFVSRAQALLQHGKVAPTLCKAMGQLRLLCREGEKLGERIYFILNDSDKLFNGEVNLMAPNGSTAEIFDAKSGKIFAFDGHLELMPYDATFVVYSQKTGQATSNSLWATNHCANCSDISSNWKITSFNGYQAPSAPLLLAKLISWSDSTNAKLKYFSGRAIYERDVNIDKPSIIDLGEVRELANVYIDGKFVTCLWEAPYRFNISAGKHTLRIEVINNWHNRVLGDAILKSKLGKEVTDSNWKYQPQSTTKPLPAGLLGPIQILSF